MIFYLAGLTVILNGCSIGPDFRYPRIKLEKDWINSDYKSLVSKAGDYRNWWKIFNDPVLDNLIERAYQENLSLKAAAMRILQARAQLGIATSQLFPQNMGISGSLQRIRASENSPGLSAGKTSTQLEFTGSAIWELDFWSKFRRQELSAKASLLSSLADYDNALVSLTADVASLYIKIRTLENRLRIAAENVKIQKESLRITETRSRLGTVTDLDVEQAKTLLNNTLAQIPELELQLKQTKNALCVLLGMEPSDLTEYLKGINKIPYSSGEILTGIPADLLRRRPDIRNAQFQAIAQSAQIGVAKTELYPAFSLNGTIGFAASDMGPGKLSDIFQTRSRSYQFGPSFEWNILNYGKIINNVRLQDARLQELLINYQNAVLKAQQEVEDNLVGFIKSQQRAQLLSQSVASARSAFELAVKQYRQGTKDFTVVLLTQQSLLNEQDNFAVALGEIAGSVVGIYRALGGGWEIRQGRKLVSEEIEQEMKNRSNWGNLLETVYY